MQTLHIQGRCLVAEDINWIRELIAVHPDWGRFQLSVHIAEQWNWRNGTGQLKDMAARTLLMKLERRGLVELPARKRGGGSRPAVVPPAGQAQLWTEPVVREPLSQLQPLTVQPIQQRQDRQLLGKLLGQFHYLGYRRPVGENLQYLVRDHRGRPLACLVFGAAAWKCAVRDDYIGWDGPGRQAHIHLLANNMRFLVLPWVEVRHLASHVLGLVVRRVSVDWQQKYGHPIYLLETFVDGGRFGGCCYRAANWIAVGSTQGRGRNDRLGLRPVPCKQVYLYPLRRPCWQAFLSAPPAGAGHE